ncbi:MAG: hypothetical protein M1838_005794 [Thelocarpon superellum]|nr:MAG: hypothetical protein M1838_005794 [Thelocarpon superellum]
MASLSASTSHSLKRPSPSDEGSARALKRQRRTISHHHRIQNRPPSQSAAPLDNEVAQSMLLRSLGLALQSAGFEGADTAALESLRAAVDEYLLRLTSAVSRSMLSSRRVQPIPQDYAYALQRDRLSYRDLQPHLRNTTPPSVAWPRIPSPPPEQTSSHSLAFVSSSNGGEKTRASAYVPSHFPPLPGEHTYKATAAFFAREEDPRRIRERVTEEGRLGEEALRRLLAAGASHKRVGGGKLGDGASIQSRRDREELWEQTMDAMTKERRTTGASIAMELDGTDDASPPARGEMMGIVNAERSFWRKGPSRGHRANEVDPDELDPSLGHSR